MGLRKGMTNNPEGRPKGSQNKITSDLRERISDFLNENWERVEKDFLILEPEKRVLIFEKLLSYSLPKMQSVQLDGNLNQSKVILFQNVSKQFPDEE